jgi:hypothetical protein
MPTTVQAPPFIALPYARDTKQPSQQRIAGMLLVACVMLAAGVYGLMASGHTNTPATIQPVSGQSQYLSLVRTQPEVTTASDAALLDLGYSACDVLDTTPSFAVALAEVAQVAGPSRAHFAGFQLAAAATLLCPEHAGEVQ